VLGNYHSLKWRFDEPPVNRQFFRNRRMKWRTDISYLRLVLQVFGRPDYFCKIIKNKIKILFVKLHTSFLSFKFLLKKLFVHNHLMSRKKIT
jgi:hypothetical protein